MTEPGQLLLETGAGSNEQKATLPPDGSPQGSWAGASLQRHAGIGLHGCAHIAFDNKDGRERLSQLYHHAPLRVLFPNPPEGDPPTAALVTTSGGLVGGDRLELSIDVGERARGLVVAQAAEKVYRSTGADVGVTVRLHAASESWAEFLPQETILFDGARLRRETSIEAASSARVLAGEMLVFGRTARGERYRRGMVRDGWNVRRDGRLLWIDRMQVEGDVERQLSAPAGFGGAVAFAMLVCMGPGCESALPLVRSLLEDAAARASATVVNQLLVVRWLDRDSLRLRRSYAQVWCALRQEMAGLRPELPRLWHV